jgi:hypothetical protein
MVPTRPLQAGDSGDLQSHGAALRSETIGRVGSRHELSMLPLVWFLKQKRVTPQLPRQRNRIVDIAPGSLSA